jgi:opacity protein-like surface antigen
MGVGFVASTYQYEQRSLQADGPLIPMTLAVGGEKGDKSATPLGGGLSVKGWLDGINVPYVGFDVGMRMSAWSLTAPEFNGQVAPDTLFSIHADVAGRYPIEIGSAQLHIAGKLGVLFNDFVYFTGSFDEGQVRYETLMVPSLRAGFEVGLEAGDIFGDIGLGYAWAYMQTPYQLNVDGTVGYQITDRFYADVSMEWYQRSLLVLGQNSGVEVGELSDQQLVFTVGAGVSF